MFPLQDDVMKLTIFSAVLAVATALPQLLLPSTLQDEFLDQFPTQSNFRRSQLPISFQSANPIIRSRDRSVAIKSQQFQLNSDGSYNHRQVSLSPDLKMTNFPIFLTCFVANWSKWVPKVVQNVGILNRMYLMIK